MVCGLIAPALAQASNSRVELAAQVDAAQLVLHVAVPRGQVIQAATLQQAEGEIALEPAPEPLPITRWVVLDASDSLINLQTAVLGALQRFVPNDGGQTGLIFYDSEIQTLMPTARQADIDAFLGDYSATASEPGCIWDALGVIANLERDLNAAWRILLVTGPLSSQAQCVQQAPPTLLAPVDVIAITDRVDESLSDWVLQTEGSILQANLRTVQPRMNEIRTRWTQPTYALRAMLDNPAAGRGDLLLTLNNDLRETLPVRLTTIDRPDPTPQPTDIVLATIPPRATDTPRPTIAPEPPSPAAAGAIPATPLPPTTATPDSAPTNPLMLAGIGVIVLGLALLVVVLLVQRRRQVPPQKPTPAGNFYDSIEGLDTNTPTTVPLAARQSRNADEWTQIADEDAAGAHPFVMDGDTLPPYQSNAEDELLVTQVLSDVQFQQMMRNTDDDVIGWVHLEGAESGDYELRRRGLTIGRSKDCDIILTIDAAISRQHARLSVDADGSAFVSRLSATNPVVVAGVLVGNNHPLNSNDVIHLSDKTRLVFIANSNEDDVTGPPLTTDDGNDNDDDLTRL